MNLLIESTASSRLAKLRDVLSLLAALRDVREPLTSPDGLRQAVALLARFAELLGVDEAWIERLQTIVVEPAVFNIVLAIVQYLAGLATVEHSGASVLCHSGASEPLAVDEHAFFEWLPIVLQILSLLGRLRGEQ